MTTRPLHALDERLSDISLAIRAIEDLGCSPESTTYDNLTYHIGVARAGGTQRARRACMSTMEPSDELVSRARTLLPCALEEADRGRSA